MTVFQSVSGLLHPKLFEGVSEIEFTAIIATVNEKASVNWVPSNVGLLSTGTLSQLEKARNVLEKEIKIARTRKNLVVPRRQNDYFKSHDQHDDVRNVNKTRSEKKREDDETSEEPKSILPDSKPGSIHHDEAVGAVRNLNKTCSERKREDSKPGPKEKIELRSRRTLEKIQKVNGVQIPEKIPRSNSKVAITQVNGTTQSHSHRDHGSSNCFPQSTSMQRRKFGGEKSGNKKRRPVEETKNNNEDRRFIKNLPNKVSVKIIQGDITNQLHTDVIVNPCNNNRLQNMSGVGAAIIDNGGLSIQIELNRTLEGQDFIPPNTVIKTSPGSLPYNNIYHLVCPQWNSSHKERSSKVLHALCLKSLNEFSETEMKTIAYPTFSSFSFPIPEDTCAHVMLNAVNMFAEKRNQSNSTVNVHFVIENHETLKVFQSEFNKLFSASTSQKTKFSKTEGKMKTTAIGKKKQLPVETASLTTQIVGKHALCIKGTGSHI